MTRRSDRRLALLAGGALALLFTMIAAVQVAAWSVGKVEHSSHRVLSGSLDELLIESENGDVTLIRSVDDKIRVDGRSEGTLRAPAPAIETDGSRVRVAANCPVWGFGECHSQVTVQVPAGTDVRVDAVSGDIVAQGVAGGVKLTTASGDIAADGLTGDASLESASGDIVARALRSNLVTAETASGDVDVRFATAPNAAEAITASGDARILVPPGPEAYNVSVDTASGGTDVGVRTDPDDPDGFLRAETSSGDATVDYGG